MINPLRASKPEINIETVSSVGLLTALRRVYNAKVKDKTQTKEYSDVIGSVAKRMEGDSKLKNEIFYSPGLYGAVAGDLHKELKTPLLAQTGYKVGRVMKSVTNTFGSALEKVNSVFLPKLKAMRSKIVAFCLGVTRVKFNKGSQRSSANVVSSTGKTNQANNTPGDQNKQTPVAAQTNQANNTSADKNVATPVNVASSTVEPTNPTPDALKAGLTVHAKSAGVPNVLPPKKQVEERGI